MIYAADVKKIAQTGFIAALYVVFTGVLAPVSFGAVQFRAAEVLNLCAFLNPVYGLGVVLGCFLSNLFFSEFGLIDVAVGTLCTGGAVFFITKTKSLLLASFMPVIFTLPVSAMIAYLSGGDFLPAFISAALTVAAGEFAVCVVAGYPLFKLLARRKGDFYGNT